jgi:ParB family chromosome partitioning protein
LRLLLEHDGSLRIERGLIHPDDLKAVQAEGAAQPVRDPAALPATMVAELTAHRTAALRIELARNPAMALAATVHALAVSLLYPASPVPASSLAMCGQWTAPPMP